MFVDKAKIKIEHIAMYVNELEKARDFFIKYFEADSDNGYHNLKTGFKSYFLTFSGEARLELMNKPQMESCNKLPDMTGYAHIAFSVGSREKVDELTERLKNDGYLIISGPRVTGDGYYESCIIDIEGNQIEICV